MNRILASISVTILMGHFPFEVPAFFTFSKKLSKVECLDEEVFNRSGAFQALPSELVVIAGLTLAVHHISMFLSGGRNRLEGTLPQSSCITPTWATFWSVLV
jgi:hypothetical protein